MSILIQAESTGTVTVHFVGIGARELHINRRNITTITELTDAIYPVM